MQTITLMRIRRDDFNRMTAGREISLRNVSPQLRNTFRSHNISDTDLRRIAGEDRVIRGPAEFDALFAAMQQGAPAAARRPGGIELSQAFFDAIPRTRPPGGASSPDRGPASPDRPATGLRGDMQQRGTARPGDDRTSYDATLDPNLVPEEAAPEEQRNIFLIILEALFGWLPFVTTDHESLEEFGNRLGDEHGAEISAAESWHRDQLSGQRSIMGMAPTDGRVRAAVREDMVQDLSRRMRAQDPELDQATATSRAGVVVDAMLTRYDANRETNRGRAAELRLPAPDSDEAAQLATNLVPARGAAERMGPEWTARLDRAMSPPTADHPVLAHVAPALHDRARAAVMSSRVELLNQMMGLAAGRDLQTPDSAVDGLLDANARGLVSGPAVMSALSSLERMPADQRTALLARIETLPPDRQHLAYATLAREHVGLRSSNETDRAASRQRIEQTVDQLPAMSMSEADRALRRGTLGLDGPEMLSVEIQNGGRTETVEIPVYAHPSVSEESRERTRSMIREAFQNMPAPMVQEMLRGEGGEAFAIQLHRDGSLMTDYTNPPIPDPDAPVGGFFRGADNQLRLNITQFDGLLAERGAREGWTQSVNVIMHESTHYDDDLADPSQAGSFFRTAGANPAITDDQRTGAGGDLEGAASHYFAIRGRHRSVTQNLDNPRARELYLLGRLDSRTPAQESRALDLSRDFAARAGAATPYGATPDERYTHRGHQMAEWWAETLTNYMNPDTRDRLRSLDPVGHAAAERYIALRTQGMSSHDAMQATLRHGLSTAVAGRQGRDMIAGASGSLSGEQLGQLDQIATSFESHASALEGWRPYRGDAGLRAMRGAQAREGAQSGRAMITQIAERRAALERNGQGNSDEHRRLGAIQQRLERSVTALEARAGELGA